MYACGPLLGSNVLTAKLKGVKMLRELIEASDRLAFPAPDGVTTDHPSRVAARDGSCFPSMFAQGVCLCVVVQLLRLVLPVVVHGRRSNGRICWSPAVKVDATRVAGRHDRHVRAAGPTHRSRRWVPLSFPFLAFDAVDVLLAVVSVEQRTLWTAVLLAARARARECCRPAQPAIRR